MISTTSPPPQVISNIVSLGYYVNGANIIERHIQYHKEPLVTKDLLKAIHLPKKTGEKFTVDIAPLLPSHVKKKYYLSVISDSSSDTDLFYCCCIFRHGAEKKLPSIYNLLENLAKKVKERQLISTEMEIALGKSITIDRKYVFMNDPLLILLFCVFVLLIAIKNGTNSYQNK